MSRPGCVCKRYTLSGVDSGSRRQGRSRRLTWSPRPTLRTTRDAMATKLAFLSSSSGMRADVALAGVGVLPDQGSQIGALVRVLVFGRLHDCVSSMRTPTYACHSCRAILTTRSTAPLCNGPIWQELRSTSSALPASSRPPPEPCRLACPPPATACSFDSWTQTRTTRSLQASGSGVAGCAARACPTSSGACILD